jgi:hypothetical protein
MGLVLAWRPFCLVGFASSRNGVSKREIERERERREGGRQRDCLQCGMKRMMMYLSVGQSFGARRCCAGERRFGRDLQGGTRKAVDERCQVPIPRVLVDVGSECTKMGGCAGLRLNRVSWSYVLAFEGVRPVSSLQSPVCSLQNPHPHPPFSIWLAHGTAQSTGHRGSGPRSPPT